MKDHEKMNLQEQNQARSEVRALKKVREEKSSDGFLRLDSRDADDSMRLYGTVISKIKDYFLKWKQTYISGQLECLSAAVEAVLTAEQGTVTVCSLAPGGGKSTLLRALMSTFAWMFATCDSPIAQRLGGVILVVEKSAEGHEYEDLCNRTAGQRVAALIESVNDFSLKRGGCINGSASCYEECLRQRCPDHADCPLMDAARHTQETPIIILLHARYQRYMENMTPFLEWYDDKGNCHPRTLLLVDELPQLICSNMIDLSAINNAENEIDQMRPSYDRVCRTVKSKLINLWERAVRRLFRQLTYKARLRPGQYHLVDQKDLEEAGFDQTKLEDLQATLQEYTKSKVEARKIVRELLHIGYGYLAVGQTTAFVMPRLNVLHGEGQPATILFSGTAALSPEVIENPNIKVLPDLMEESYARLKIVVQHGDAFKVSKTALSENANFLAMVTWLREILAELSLRHNKVLVVTYQMFASSLWHQLSELHDWLIPYIDGAGNPQDKTPYFGGMNGSNVYREATCVICAGLPRFEMWDYLVRALAVDFKGQIYQEFQQFREAEKPVQLDRLAGVRTAQNITLARDIVQLVFRSALRNHGEQQPIELWLAQPPNAVVDYLAQYFGDCQIEEAPELSVTCKLASLDAKSYKGQQPHWVRLLKWLYQWDGIEVTPAQIREQLGMTQPQFKEAMRHKAVRSFFQEWIITTGSGRNTRYCPKGGQSPAA